MSDMILLFWCSRPDRLRDLISKYMVIRVVQYFFVSSDKLNNNQQKINPQLMKRDNMGSQIKGNILLLYFDVFFLKQTKNRSEIEEFSLKNILSFIHDLSIINVLKLQYKLGLVKAVIDMQTKFKQAELSLGLRKQFYDAKFVYSQQQVSNHNGFLIPLFKSLPSQLHGFLQSDILIIHAFGSEILRQAAKSLGVPISTLVVAQSLFHFFYARKSFLEYDIRDTIMGCMYLACKSEQTLKRSYEIAFVFDYLFKLHEGQQSPKALVVSSSEYEHMKNTTIMKAELDILFQLGFQIYRLLDIPHRYLGLFLNFFEKNPLYPKICQSSWKKLNDCYHTTACLYYPHNVIAAAAVYMGLKEAGAKFPEIPWWTLLEAYEEAIINIQVMVEMLYLNTKQISFSKISSRIKQIGENYGLVNPFPVSYYRKIWLEKKGKLRVSKIQLQRAQNQQKQAQKEIELQNQRQQGKMIDRKIAKIKKIQEKDEPMIMETSQNKTSNKQAQKQKIQIDKKGLLANINEKLSKHSNILNKPAKKCEPSSSSSSEMSEQEQLIAELKRKKQQNKQTNQAEQEDKKQMKL